MDRYRTIAKALEEIKKIDPNTCLNENNIREMAKHGQFSYTTVGRKIMVNLDSLIESLNGNDINPKIRDITPNTRNQNT